MELRASVLLDDFRESGLLTERRGSDAAISGVAAADGCGPGDLVFVDREAYLQLAKERGASVVITTEKLAPSEAPRDGLAVLITGDVKLARALILQRYFDRDPRSAAGPRVHPTASIHPDAVVAESARVGAGVVIGAGARIGERCVLFANVVIEENAQLGDGTVLHPGVVIGHACELGRDVIVRAGAVIGSEGFGFAQDAQRRSHRIPHLGNVILEDRVVIGALCCIDRGAHDSTRIGAGTVMDNLCHIAHNVQIGKDCILTAMLCVAGSTKIGDRVVTSGQVGIIDHLEIASDTVLLHRAGVTSSIEERGTYAGVPLLPLAEHMKSQVVIRRLPDLRDQLRALEKRLEALEERQPPES